MPTTSPIKPTSAVPLAPWLTGVAMPLVMLIITSLLGWMIWSVQTNTTSQKEVLARIESQDRRLAVLDQIATTQTDTLRQVVKAQAEEAQRLVAIETFIRMQQQQRPKEVW